MWIYTKRFSEVKYKQYQINSIWEIITLFKKFQCLKVLEIKLYVKFYDVNLNTYDI